EAEQDARHLAEKALSLEQYRQEVLGKAADPAETARRLQKLRQHWAAQNTAATRRSEQERKALQADLARCEERCRKAHKQAEELAAHEADFNEKRLQWEHEQALSQAEEARRLHETRTLIAQRDRYQQQVTELQDEIERLVLLLLDEKDNQVQLFNQ